MRRELAEERGSRTRQRQTARCVRGGKRGCSTLVIALGPSERALVQLLRGMGRVRVQDDSARVDLGEYARLHGLSSARS
jgi:hypothetical protein